MFSRSQLRVYARALRNLALMFGFFGGLAGYLALLAGLLLLLFMPDLIRPYLTRYGEIAIWLGVGLVSGVMAARQYRRAYPHNPGGAGTLALVVTGLCVLIGVGFAFLGIPGGVVAILFGVLGAWAYVYLERTNESN